MNAEIVTIGRELLDGSQVDTNAAYLGERLTALGAEVTRTTTVSDDAESIERAVAAALESADIVVTTGGLGVTSDDRTKHAVARLMGRKLVLDEEILEEVRARFEARGLAMPEVNISQAMIPEGARPIENHRGTAPGLMFDRDEALLFVLPGVPSELKSMFEHYVAPFLEGRGLKRLTEERMLRTTGISESEVAERVGPLVKRLARIDVAYLPAVTGVDLKIIGRGQTRVEAARTADSALEKLAAKLEPYAYARGGESLEQIVGYLLSMAGKTLSVAESCTGGLMGSRLTRVPGSSEYFLGGVISYSDDIKKRLLGVKASTINKKGAVSPEAALEMAQGVRDKAHADVGVAITGIAGPGGATEEKPVGLVYIAVALGKRAEVREFRFSGGRSTIRKAASQAALDLVRRDLLSIKDD